MILLIYGDFCVGKDTVADILANKINANKIRSYTTRPPRFMGEDTHEFCTKEEFEQFDDLIAFSEIDGEFYGARRSQFNDHAMNIYVVDKKGVYDVLNSDVKDHIFVLKVVRPVWLRNCSKARQERSTSFDGEIKVDYILYNDGSIERLHKLCTDFLVYFQQLYD